MTFLLFLKMADEQSRAPFNKPSPVPKDFDWQSLLKRDGDELETHYRHVLESLGKQKGMFGVIFRKARNKFHLFRMVAATNWGTWKLTGEDGLCDSVTSNEIAVCG